MDDSARQKAVDWTVERVLEPAKKSGTYIGEHVGGFALIRKGEFIEAQAITVAAHVLCFPSGTGGLIPGVPIAEYGGDLDAATADIKAQLDEWRKGGRTPSGWPCFFCKTLKEAVDLANAMQKDPAQA